MPKFHRQNRKKLNPRYFLNESVEREDLIDDIREFSKAVADSRDTYGDIDKIAEMDLQELEEYFKSLISLTQGYDKENYRLASSVMQDDAKIPADKVKIGKQLKIPGLS